MIHRSPPDPESQEVLDRIRDLLPRESRWKRAIAEATLQAKHIVNGCSFVLIATWNEEQQQLEYAGRRCLVCGREAQDG